MTSTHAPMNAVAPTLRSEGDSVAVVSEQLRAAWAKLAELGHADAIKSALVDAARSLHDSFRELRTKYAPGTWRARLASLTPDGRRRLQEYSWLEDLGRLFEASASRVALVVSTDLAHTHWRNTSFGYSPRAARIPVGHRCVFWTVRGAGRGVGV